MWLIELWRERQSFGRLATRLERAAQKHDYTNVVERLNELRDLHDEDVRRRIAMVPEPIHYWHRQSLQARRYVGEPVTQVQDARDVLLVATHYELRKALEPPYPEWLAIAEDSRVLEERAAKLAALIDEVMPPEVRP
jgi:hypothetical protein